MTNILTKTVTFANWVTTIPAEFQHLSDDVKLSMLETDPQFVKELSDEICEMDKEPQA